MTQESLTHPDTWRGRASALDHLTGWIIDRKNSPAPGPSLLRATFGAGLFLAIILVVWILEVVAAS